MTLGIAMVTTDSTNPVPLARWWAERLGGSVVAENDGWFVIVTTPAGTLAFQRVGAVTPGKNRLHLDLSITGSLDSTRDELIAAGATLVADHTEGDMRWITLADPDGNQFCIAPEAE